MNQSARIKSWSHSKISNSCIVRITNRCDDCCQHCAFRSSPKNIGSMSVDMAAHINRWVPRGIVLNIMGGEFTVLPNYEEIIMAMVNDRSKVRLVTNGQWASSPKSHDKFITTIKRMKQICGDIDIVVSNDDWHKQKYPAAIETIQRLGMLVSELQKNSDWNNLTPVGRAWDNGLITRLTKYAASCETMCCMIITEDGTIHNCPYGYFPLRKFWEATWEEQQEIVWTWRSEQLSNGMMCVSCMKSLNLHLVK